MGFQKIWSENNGQCIMFDWISEFQEYSSLLFKNNGTNSAKNDMKKCKSKIEPESKQNDNEKQFAFHYELVKGDLFTCPETSSIGHCVARDLGMGKGIATSFKREFGGLSVLKKQNAKVGECAILMRQNRFIYYLITKKRSGDKPTYKTIGASLRSMKNHAVINDVEHISLPKIGCGLDRLQWNRVEEIICDIFKNTNIRISVSKL